MSMTGNMIDQLYAKNTQLQLDNDTLRKALELVAESYPELQSVSEALSTTTQPESVGYNPLDNERLREAEDAAWNNFEAIQPIENWLIEHDLLMVIHEGDGKAAGLNILESVKAIHAKNQITT
jgi:hypothetical protein